MTLELEVKSPLSPEAVLNRNLIYFATPEVGSGSMAIFQVLNRGAIGIDRPITEIVQIGDHRYKSVTIIAHQRTIEGDLIASLQEYHLEEGEIPQPVELLPLSSHRLTWRGFDGNLAFVQVTRFLRGNEVFLCSYINTGQQVLPALLEHDPIPLPIEEQERVAKLVGLID